MNTHKTAGRRPRKLNVKKTPADRRRRENLSGQEKGNVAGERDMSTRTWLQVKNLGFHGGGLDLGRVLGKHRLRKRRSSPSLTAPTMENS